MLVGLRERVGRDPGEDAEYPIIVTQYEHTPGLGFDSPDTAVLRSNVENVNERTAAVVNCADGN